MWITVGVVIFAGLAATGAWWLSRSATSGWDPVPTPKSHHTVTAISIAEVRGCTPGTTATTLSLQVYYPTQFPATAAGWSPNNTSLDVGLNVTNPSSAPETVQCIWTYAPFVGNAPANGSEEPILPSVPEGSLPWTISGGQYQEIQLTVGVPPAANNQTLELVVGLAS